tara:strand:+ start:2752 stop:3036 length:285 start_codon:yes stop_codon:yes gene_type:complete
MAKEAKLPDFYSNLTNTLKPEKDRKGLGGGRKSARSIATEVRQQAAVSTKFERKPTPSEGTEGDTKLVKDGDKYYSYHKIGKEWFKTELERDNG